MYDATKEPIGLKNFIELGVPWHDAGVRLFNRKLSSKNVTTIFAQYFVHKAVV